MLVELGIAGGLLGAGFAAGYYATYGVRSQWLGPTTWQGDPDTDSVAITFDDGPSEDTAAILDVLKEYGVKAAFFMVGKQVEKFPEIARRALSEGHEIGNHSLSHSIYLYQRPKRTAHELQRTQEIIGRATGVTPRFARPPCGVRTPAYFAAARRLGLSTVQWSVAGMDWKPIPASEITRNVLSSIGPGSIVLLHDGDDGENVGRASTVATLPAIIEGIWAKNLRIDPLQSMIGAEVRHFRKEGIVRP